MKNKLKKPFVPEDRQETVRMNILSVIKGRPLSAREISAAVRIPEKAVFEHLEHIQKSVHRKGMTLVVIPSECRKCGFVFSKRGKLKKPGRCPQCRNETINDPVFSITAD